MAIVYSDGGDIELTSSATRQFGSVSVEINMPSSGYLNTTFKMKSLPKIAQDFDAKEGFGDIGSIKTNLSEVEFEIFDGIGDGGSFFNLVSNLEVNEVITIKVTVNGATDYFLSNRQQVEYDWLSRICKIKGTAALKYGVEVTNYNFPISKILGCQDTGVYSFPSSISTFPCALSGDLIYEFLACQGANQDVVVVSPFFNFTKQDAESVSPDTPFWNVYSISGTRPNYIAFNATSAWQSADSDIENVSNYVEAESKVLQMSILECAIVGSMRGYSFYVPRIFNEQINIPIGISSVSTESTVSADDVSEFSMSNHRYWANEYKTTFGIFNKYSDDQKRSDVETGNELTGFGGGSKNVTLSYLMQAQVISYDGTDWWIGDKNGEEILDSGIDDINETKQIPLNPTKVVLDHYGRIAYAASLGISVADEPFGESYYASLFSSQLGNFRVEMTILGIDKVLPFQYVKFDSSGFHPSVNGRKLRPSMIEYDLDQNKIKIEGFFIG